MQLPNTTLSFARELKWSYAIPIILCLFSTAQTSTWTVMSGGCLPSLNEDSPIIYNRNAFAAIGGPMCITNGEGMPVGNAAVTHSRHCSALVQPRR